MDPVRPVDVGVSRWPEHRLVAGGSPSAVTVARRIFVVVRLDLDDSPADSVDEQRRADELRRDLVDAAREESPAKLHSRARRES